ncbi:MAG: TIGR02117 family protein [Erythrobacter sp.]
MAAQAPLVLKLLRLFTSVLVGLAVIAIVYLLAAWIGSAIPRNADWTPPDDGVQIMVETNGIHTAIVMPLVTEHKDWRTDFPAQHTTASHRPVTHVSVSWGEKQVFLTAEDWADLTPAAAFGAIYGGEGLLHVAHYVRPAPSPDHRMLTISAQDYRKLVASIEPYVASPEAQTRYPGYSYYDVFYDAPGDYNAVMTCNQWTADRLADAGIKTAWWSPFARGVMQYVPDPS